MKLSSLGIVLVLPFIAVSCDDFSDSTAESHNQSGEEPGFEVVATTPGQFDGRRLTLRGYLTGTGPTYLLANSPDFTPKSLVIPVADDFIIDQERGYLQDLGCTDSYVEVVGVFGFLAQHDSYGISTVETIRAFGSEGLAGDGRICYVRAG